MYFLKRARLYITRKWGKTITVGIILFVVSTLVLTGLLIRTASQNTFEMAREKLGATVSYTTDLSSVMQNGNGERPTKRGTGGGFTIPDDFTSITTKEVELIASKSKYVDSYTIAANLSAEAVAFTYYDPSSSEDETETTTNDFGGMPRFQSSANIRIVGADIEGKETSFDRKTITEGRYFTDEEINNSSKVIIIEKTIADLNNINIGDSIKVEKVENKGPMNNSDDDTSDAVELTYEVVGIYKTSTPTDLTTSGFMSPYNLSENTMYAPYTTVLSSDLEGLVGDELTTAQNNIKENGYTVQNVTFTLTDPDYTDKFIEEVKNMDGIDTTYRSLSANDAAYEQMVGPIENVANTSTVLVIVVVIAGAFIIGLLSMLSIKDRKYELGVLLSLGESRFKIVSQLICEMIIVASLSFALATVTSNFTSQLTTDFLLNQELSANSTEDNSISEGMKFTGGGMFFRNRDAVSKMDVEAIDTLTVSVNIMDILKMFGIGIIIIVIGNVIQAMFVLRCNPKQILLER